MSAKDIKYSEALKQIEDIIHSLENEENDIDETLKKVKKASELLKICKNRLYEVEKEINEILKDMDKEFSEEEMD